MNEETTREGGCAGGEIRYRMAADPMIVHCCHCRWCQRETGSAFVVNALIEADRVVVDKGDPESLVRPSQSGKGQTVWFCPTCRSVLWSNYAGAGPAVRFVRAGTLDDPARVTPDIHIFTESKQPWVIIPDGAKSVPEFYRFADFWPPESLARIKAALSGAGR